MSSDYWGLQPTGEIYSDLKSHFPYLDWKVLVDVGANIGQTASDLRDHFPASQIHAMEPVSASFKKLRSNTKNDTAITCHQLALGSRDETLTIRARGTSTGNSVLNIEQSEDSSERISSTTGDNFCRSKSIARISFLKIDTEGYDAEVIKGFSGMLNNQSIDIVQVEVGMNQNNKKHAKFATLYDMLISFNYDLFYIYEQVKERRPRLPFLRRSNPVFISLECARHHTPAG